MERVIDQTAVSDPQDLRQRRDSHRRSSKREGLLSGKRYSRRSKLILLALGFSWLLIFFLVLFFSIQFYQLRQENRALRVALKDSEDAREPLAAEVERLRAATEDLLGGRLPGLREIVLDEVITLDQSYVKNILFSRISSVGEPEYEYRVVLENSAFFRVWPQVSIFFFDEFGIQLGTAEIGAVQVRAVLDNSSLGPGEAQSFSGLVSFAESRPPRYFRLRLESLANSDDEDQSDENE